jgi:hypothetical protein
LASPISHEDAESAFDALVSAVNVRELGDDEVERFASLLGKFILLSVSHAGAVDFLERESVKRAIYKLGVTLSSE